MKLALKIFIYKIISIIIIFDFYNMKDEETFFNEKLNSKKWINIKDYF